MNFALRTTLIVGLVLSLSACVNSKPERQKSVEIQQAPATLSEARLMDVNIRVFEPGPIEEDERSSLGISHQTRQSEARFVPVHLKATMERTGNWGAIRVVPASARDGELLIGGEILVSDGEQLVLHVTANDASGAQWLDKHYRGVARQDDHDRAVRGERDAFQDLYNEIANDLARLKGAQSERSLKRNRQINELRFAADLAPAAFGDHLRKNDAGLWQIVRLPAEGDPMLQRVRSVRERDLLLVDTVNGHYESFYRDVWDPYNNWRRFRSEELDNLREVENDATTRKVLGIGAVVGAIAIGLMGSDRTVQRTDSLRDAMVIGGVMAAKSGFDMDKETEIHVESIKELGESFQADAEDLVIEVDGEAHRLTGSAEEQYAKWRSLLSRIYASETGFTSKN